MEDFTNFDPSKRGGGSGDERPVLPPGVYVLVIKKFQRTTSKAGNDGILFVCKPMFEAGGKPYDHCENVLENCTLTSAASWRLANLCKAVGRERPFNAMSDEDISMIFVGEPIKARVIHDTYNGKVSAKVKEYFLLLKRDLEKVQIMMDDWQVDNPSDYGDSGGDSGEYQSDVPPPTDDDIPF